MSNTEHFFEVSKEHSRIKSNIVVEYFNAWAKIIIKMRRRRPDLEQRVCFVDLFSGPGCYDDGTESTPLKVVRSALSNRDFARYVQFLFNDGDPKKADQLRGELDALAGVDSLSFPPQVTDDEIHGAVPPRMWARLRGVPSMAFVDPFGYKGISADLLLSLVRDWGRDCIYFFNYNRINAAIPNPNVEDSMRMLFGEDEHAELRARMRGLAPREREAMVLDTLKTSLRSKCSDELYIEMFCFRDVESERTKHYIMGLTTNFEASTIMKSIMAKYSTVHRQGVATFSHDPHANTRQQDLFPVQPVDELAEELPRLFAGQRLRFQELFRRHSVGRPYEKRHYQQVLLRLEAQGRVALFSLSKGGKIGPDTIVAFADLPP